MKIIRRIFFNTLLLIILLFPTSTAYAQDATSNCVITNIGNSNLSSLPTNCQNSNNGGAQGSAGTSQSGSYTNTGNRLVNHANELVLAAQTNCRAATYDYIGAPAGTIAGAITSDDEQCLIQQINSLGWQYPSAAVSQVQLYADSFAPSGVYYQCVGFVQTVIAGLYGGMLDNGGNAENFIGNNQNFGYVYVSKASGQKIQPGDIALYSIGSYGHIAIVIKEFDTNTPSNPYNFVVAEANWLYDGYINNTRMDSYNNPAFVGWLHQQ